MLILPYLGFQCEKFRKKLNGLVSKFYGGIIVKVVFRNRNNIGSHFKCKDRIDKLSKSNVVYQYSCDICGDSYIGKTIRTLKERKSEHFKALTKDYLHYIIANHVFKANHNSSFDNFTIIDTASNNYSLTVKESLNILEKGPKINENNDFNLYLFYFFDCLKQFLSFDIFRRLFSMVSLLFFDTYSCNFTY